MNTSKSNIEFFDPASIDKYCILSNKLILVDNIYYFGSYILDINGNRLRDIDLWAGDYKDDDNERKREIANREDYKNIYSIFTSKDNNPSSSITECIQKQYLKIQDQVLHLFCVSEKRCYEIISRKDEILMRKGINHEQFDDYQSLLTDLGRKNESTIESTFDYHFNLIKKAQSPHIYFFPTILRLSGTIKVINVSTIISPSLLEDDNITNIQYGLEISTSCLMSDAANYLYKLAQDKAVKSAKAAIMSRNMSHNLGSHVMSYLKHNLSSVTTMMRDNVLQEIISCGTNNILSLNRHISKEQINDDIALPFLLGLGHFISYIQERQDFIATIATDYIPYNSTVNFKDYIYDELNPDKRFERHIERSNLKIDNILFGNIARSEGLGRFTTPTKGEQSKLCDIVLKFGKFDGNKGSSEEDLEKLRNFDVSLPGGIVGRQAIFSILENVIRNAAKHGKWKKSGKLEFTIEYYTKDTIGSAPDYDNYEGCYNLRKVLESFYQDAQDSDNLYFVTITDNTEMELKTLKKLRQFLCEDYIYSSKKGLMEMRISASWLRSIINEDKCYNPYLQYKDNDELIGTDSFPPINKAFLAPILYARLHKPRKYSLSYNLQYIICLPKPRGFAVIINDKTKKDRNNWIEFIDIIIKNEWGDFRVFNSVDKFKDQNNKSFDFIICENEFIYNKIRPVSSAKTFHLSEREIEPLVKKEDANTNKSLEKHAFIDKLYKSIYKDTDNEYIVIDDRSVYEKARALYNDGKCVRIEILAKGKEDKIIIYNIDRVISFHKNMTDGQETRKEESKEIYEGFPDGIYYRVGHIIVGNATTPIYSMYSYRTHHEANIQFEDFMNNAHGHRIRFVEGITGNNATDRLVRHNALLPSQSNRWFFSHLHAMKQKVAIIDERIFYKIYGIDEANFVRGNAYLPQTDHLSNDAELEKDLLMAKEHYLRFIPDKARINKAKDMKTLQNTVSFSFSDRIRCKEVYTKGYLGYTYYQKDIMMFTFIPGVEAHEFELVGIQLEDGVVVVNNNSFECKCTPIAKITWNRIENKLKLDLLNNYVKFDFISIHQGLLDKLFEDFDKNDNDEKDFKKEIIKQLFDIFSSHTTLKEKSQAFYPGLFIHSGRSKSSDEDMPSVPFIQYATLEHAILDCKYSLVELLDNARYE